MAASGERIRVFIAVGVSGEAREALAEVAGRLRGRLPEGVQWARLEGLHLTLKFLGNISPRMAGPLAECLQAPAQEAAPFRLGLAELGVFPNPRRPRVLWAGLEGDLNALAGLQAAVEQAVTGLGYAAEERPFSPHITLGRVRRGVSGAALDRVADAMAEAAPPTPVSWTVDEVRVMRSHLLPTGAEYTVIGSAPLSIGSAGIGSAGIGSVGIGSAPLTGDGPL